MNIKQQKITYHISPLWAWLAVLLFLGCLGLGYYYYDTSDSNQSTKRRLSGTIRTAQANIASLSPSFSDAKATETRDRAAKLKESMRSGEEIDSFVAGLRPTWTVVSKTETPNEEYIVRRYQIVRGSVAISAWDEVLDLSNRLKTINSLAFTQIDVQTVGDNKKREFSRIALSFTVYIKKPAKEA